MPNGLLDFFADPAERANIRQGFMDAVNRGAVGAALGAPVDMVNSLLNLGKAGYGYVGNKTGLLSADQMPELIDNPVGGSEYIGNQMRRLGVVSPNRNALAEGLAGFLPMSPSTSAKAVAAIGAGGLMPGVDAAATVWHGSPHKFDRFDSSKIGTGEGAQAYGHGLYVAEDPRVAQSYKDALGAGRGDRDEDTIARLLDAYNGDAAKASAELDRRAQYANIPGGKERLRGLAEQVRSGVDPRGSLYKVDLPDEAIAKMLDYDKPINQQSLYVRNALERAGINFESSALAGPMAIGQEAHLQKHGIPGIRYLDGGSRSAGQGSSNFVVFPGNEGLLSILERNGQSLK